MKLNFSILLYVTALLYSTTNATLSSSEKSSLLSKHKSTRSAVGASNMSSISWDDSLAESAEAYAKKCPGSKHDRTRQNLAYGGKSATALYELWANEKSDFLKSGQVDYFTGEDYSNRDIGHYSQVVWAENTKVGCGFNNCGSFNQLVCHYGIGNIKKQKVYEGGERGSKSDNKTTSKKSTTIKKTTTTTTTTIKQAVTPAPASKKIKIETSTAKNVVNTTKAPIATINKGIPLGSNNTTAKVPAGTITGNLATPTSGLNAGVNGISGTKGTVGVNATSNSADAKSKTNDESIKISEIEDNNDDNTDKIVTGVAITGSVVGAAAAFVFLKKNPKQYEKLTRSLTSVKRGATKVTRRLTTKKIKTTPPTTTTEPNNDNSNYRIDFTENMQSQA